MVTCQICQHENPEGAEYCEDCGALLIVSTPADAQATTPPSEVTSPADVPADSAAAETPAPAPLDAAAPVSQTEPLPADAVPDLPVEMEAPTDGAAAAASAPSTVTPAPQEPAATPASAGGNPRLLAVRHGAPTGEEYPLLGQRLVVGRFDPETGPVDVDLSEAPESVQISRHHAEVYREADGRWHVKDLGSTNGVFVRTPDSATFGPRLTEPRALNAGDEVAFGNARFIFQLD